MSARMTLRREDVRIVRRAYGSHPWSVLHVPTGETVHFPVVISTWGGDVPTTAAYFRLRREAQAAIDQHLPAKGA